MFFTDIVFLVVFLPVLLFFYYVLFRFQKAQNILLIIASVLFYLWGGTIYTLGILILTVLNYILGIFLERWRKKLLFLAGIIMNLSFVVVFKYSDFLFNTFHDLGGKFFEFSFQNWLLPIGLSFYVLRAVAYLVDIYQYHEKAEKNFLKVAFYFLAFFYVIAGPLEPFQSMKTQFDKRKFTLRMVSVGICRFATGIIKKVLIADQLYAISGQIFNLAQIGPDVYTVSAATSWLGAITFALQLTFAYSAYCDMAIGLGLMFGFQLNENFMFPFAASSITEFWSKWNSTLWNWCKRYVYNIDGEHAKQNRDSMLNGYLLIWIFIGFFYGGRWTFFFWGIMQFIFIAVELFFHLSENKSHYVIRNIFVWIIIILGIVLFASKDLYQAGNFYYNMVGRGGVFDKTFFMMIREYWEVLLAAIVFSYPITKKVNEKLALEQFGKWNTLLNATYPVVIGILVIISLSLLQHMPDVEFQFIRF